MRQDLTEIAFILDRSGSMAPLTEAAISGFNSFLRDQQQAEGDARLTLLLFDDEFLYPADSVPIAEVVELDTTTYIPRGSTALLDAIGKTIRKVEERLNGIEDAQRPGKVVFAIYTDGYENASLDFTWKDVAKLIRTMREKHGWEFLFLGANQDAIATASQLSIDRASTAQVGFSAGSMRASTRSFSRKISSFRKGDPKDEDFSKPMSDIVDEEEHRDDEEDPGENPPKK